MNTADFGLQNSGQCWGPKCNFLMPSHGYARLWDHRGGLLAAASNVGSFKLYPVSSHLRALSGVRSLAVLHLSLIAP